MADLMAGDGSTKSHVRFGVWLHQGPESEESLVFNLNPCKGAWTLLQDTRRSLPLVQSPTATANIRNVVQEVQTGDVVRQANGCGRRRSFNTSSECKVRPGGRKEV